MIETYRGVVYPHQMDHMEHMNVQWYTARFDEATWHLMSRIGVNAAYMKKNNRGMVAVEQLTKYKAEVISGELLVIKSKFLEFKDKAVRFLHIMYEPESGKEVASTELVGVHIDRVSRKSCSFPLAIKEKCTAFISDQSHPSGSE